MMTPQEARAQLIRTFKTVFPEGVIEVFDLYVQSLITSGGTDMYTGASPSNFTIGDLPSGSVLTGKTVSQILEAMLVGYLDPSFASFLMAGQGTSVEVGATLSGSKPFAFSFSNVGNVQDNTLVIRDATNNVDLITGAPLSSPQNANIGTIQKIIPGAHSWQGKATNTQSTVFNSSLFTINWYWMLYFGTSASVTLNEAGIEGLLNQQLQASKNGTYALAAGDYKYFVWDDSLGSPTAGTGFKDASTLLPISMADSSDNAAYSNTQNGWSYALVSVTNAQGITSNKRVYRTKNTLGGSINIIVS